jgi:hypothetical protein
MQYFSIVNCVLKHYMQVEVELWLTTPSKDNRQALTTTLLAQEYPAHLVEGLPCPNFLRNCIC